MLARLAGTWSLVVVAGVIGCGSNQNQAAAAPACEAAEGDLPMDATASAWAGEYSLVMVATAGDSAGRSVSGTVQLKVQSEELQAPPLGSADGGTRMLLYGSTDIDLRAILAVEIGVLDSDDPLAPGVLVLERAVELDGGSSKEIVVRLGSEANRRGVTRFDGGYTALFVRQASTGGFAGNWASGVTGQMSSGHFCASKADH
jgi:hypothetical protein